MTNAVSASCRVVKVGGSLLSLEDLTLRLRRWLAQQSPSVTLVVVGGGAAADLVRDFDRRHQLGDEAAHWLAVQAMTFNARLLAAALPDAAWLKSLAQLPDLSGNLSIVDCYQVLRHDEGRQQGTTLPASWEVTSDSIAAHLATRCQAGELVLFKSALSVEVQTVTDAISSGLVDRYFATASRRIARIRCVNLRDDRFSEQKLLVG